MHFRLVSKNADAIALLPRLKELGHKVDFWVKEKEAKPSYAGMIPQVEKYDEGLTKDSVLLFDMVGLGNTADALKLKYPVYGGGKINDMLELKRDFGMQIAKAAGVKVPHFEKFTDFDEAIALVKKSDKSWVFKPQNNKSPCQTYVSQNTDDMVAMLNYYKGQDDKADFVLQEKIDGTELSCEAWYVDGEIVPNSINSTVETKRFMEGDKGPNCGCMGSVVWFWKQKNPKIFRHTLARLQPFLKRYKYNGPLDVNCIVSEKDGLPYFLEFTARFGYSALYAAASELGKLDDLFITLATGKTPVIQPTYRYCGAVRLSVPPYPNEEGIVADRPLPSMEGGNIWPLDVKRVGKSYYTAGVDGVVCEYTGAAENLDKLQAVLYTNGLSKMVIPDVQYRSDLCIITKNRIDKLRKQNYF